MLNTSKMSISSTLIKLYEMNKEFDQCDGFIFTDAAAG